MTEKSSPFLVGDEVQRDAVRLAIRDNFLVIDRAARRENRLDTGVGENLDTVRKRKE